MTDEQIDMGEGEEGEIEITRDMVTPEIELAIALDVCAGLLYRIVGFARDASDVVEDIAEYAAELEEKAEPDIFLGTVASNKNFPQDAARTD